VNELPVSNEFPQVTKKESDETRVDKGLVGGGEQEAAAAVVDVY
jgi:hypothetical protein